MTKLMIIFPMLAAAAMSGCMTTEEMPDGTTKIRFSDEAVKSMTSMMPKELIDGLAGAGGGDDLDLIPVRNRPASNELTYLGARFDYPCTAALMYSAQSGKPLDGKMSDVCRQRYLIRQHEYKQAGLPHDRSAPDFDAYNSNQAYWASLTRKIIDQLAKKQRFNTRFTGIPRAESNGRLSIAVGFVSEGKNSQNYGLGVRPSRTDVVFSDPDFEKQMRSKMAQMKTAVGDATMCEVVLSPRGAVDNGPKPASVYASDYTRYEALFNLVSMSCRNALYQFKGAAR